LRQIFDGSPHSNVSFRQISKNMSAQTWLIEETSQKQPSRRSLFALDALNFFSPKGRPELRLFWLFFWQRRAVGMPRASV
jgi:hypothetical protein